MIIKISYLIAAIDSRTKPGNNEYFRLFFNDKNEIPSLTLESFDHDEYEILKTIHEQHIKYAFNFYPKVLCGFRVLDKDFCEVCYLTTVKYMVNCTMSGNFYTLEQIQQKNILLEEYYGELFFKFGQSAVR